MRGRPRQEIKLNERVGNFIILRRSGRIHRPNHRGGEHFYIGKCVVCDVEVEKTMWGFRNYPTHPNCPALIEKLSLRTREVAYKQQPGLFAHEQNIEAAPASKPEGESKE